MKFMGSYSITLTLILTLNPPLTLTVNLDSRHLTWDPVTKYITGRTGLTGAIVDITGRGIPNMLATMFAKWSLEYNNGYITTARHLYSV